MGGKQKIYKIMQDWYKPTKRGERARQLLQGEAGTVGEDVKKRKNSP